MSAWSTPLTPLARRFDVNDIALLHRSEPGINYADSWYRFKPSLALHRPRITDDRPNSFPIFRDQRPTLYSPPPYRWLINVRPDEQSGKIFLPRLSGARGDKDTSIPVSIPIPMETSATTGDKGLPVSRISSLVTIGIWFNYSAIVSRHDATRRVAKFVKEFFVTHSGNNFAASILCVFTRASLQAIELILSLAIFELLEIEHSRENYSLEIINVFFTSLFSQYN